MVDQIHYRLSNGIIYTGPVDSSTYENWVECCAKGCSTWIEIPNNAVQAWCWKCHPRNTRRWREIHMQRLKDSAQKRHEQWLKNNQKPLNLNPPETSYLI